MTQKEIRKSLEASAKESYTPKTDEEIQKQAEGMYKQQFENDLKSLRDQTEQNILKAQRDSIASGMQRSSYVAAQQGLVRNAGLESQRQLQSNYETNLANAIADLRDKDKDRKLADDQYRNQLLLQLYNMGGSSGRSGSPGTQKMDDTKDDTKDDTQKNNYNLLRDFSGLLDGVKAQYLPLTKIGTTVNNMVKGIPKIIPSISVPFKNADGTTSTKYVNSTTDNKSIALIPRKTTKK